MIPWAKPSEFSKNVMMLFTGSALAQALPIAISPILTRLYTPQDFGIFTVFFSLTTLFSTVITARYEMAIVLPHEDSEALNLERLCILISALASSVLLLFIFIFHTSLLKLLGNDALHSWLYVAPASIFFSGIIQTISYRLNRKKNFKRIAYLKLTQAGTSSVSSLSFGVVGSLVRGGLLAGYLAGQIGILVLEGQTIKLFKKIDWQGIKQVASKYKNFALYNTPSALLDKAASSLPVFFLSRIFDKKITGFYGLVERVIHAPVSLISYSFSQVLLEDIAHRHKNNLAFRKKILKVLGTLALIGALPFSLLFFFSPQIFAFAFGQAWYEAGEYASFLSVAFFARFCISPLSTVFIATNTLKTLTLWQLLYFVTSAGVIVYGLLHPTIETFLLAYTLNDVVLYLIYLFLILKTSQK